jgi:glycosyltransferase involved in cell wall biosynthesis
MRIGFDAQVLTEGKSAAAVYLANLVENLVKVAPRAEIFLFSPDKVFVDYEPHLHFPQVHRVVTKVPRDERRRWVTHVLPALLKENSIEVFHAPVRTSLPLFSPPCPTVLTVFDIIPGRFPGSFQSLRESVAYGWRHWAWARKAARILTVTDTGKKDVLRACRIASEQVVVTPLGAGETAAGQFGPAEAEEVLKKYHLDGKTYVVSVSGLDRSRRRPDLILEAFSICHRDIGRDVHFVFTGENGRADGYYQRSLRKMEMLGIRDKVVTTGFIPDKVFKVILANAKVAVINPLFTGTSLAVLEAMANGVPVVATGCGAIPEVAGDAVVLFEPYDTAALADAIRRLLEDPAEHATYVAKGRARAEQFSWEKMAEKTLEVYQGIIK